ncbi:MAG: hypothetical protein IT166_12220 [Bryobacterales bacterium]|nr:hypothetical protein [Bryobacterales bacterium]
MKCLPVFLLAASGLCAADLSGIWVGRIPGRNGAMPDVAFQFRQSGTVLSGKLYGDYQSTKITEGKISGDEVDFLVVTAEQAGNQINETRMRFTGKMVGAELELTRKREGSRNAGNGGGVQLKQDAGVTFRLKRLI